MFVIVGLGNPGFEYVGTRHNIGRDVLFRVLDQNGFGKPVSSNKYAAYIAEGVFADHEVLFLFPETFMNKSGTSVKKVITKKEEAKRLIVVYDDIDMPAGEVKVSFGKGAGGHNGVASIIDALGTKEFVRVRIGIAGKSFWGGKPRRPKGGAAMTRHVLGAFKKREARELAAVEEKVDAILKTVISKGVEQAMNEYN